MIRTGQPRRGKVLLVCLLLGCSARLAPAAITQAQSPPPARFGSDHIVVQFTETYARDVRAERARSGVGLVRTVETLGPQELVEAMQRWRVAGMRPVFEAGFAAQDLARAHGLDRYFIMEAPRGTDVATMADEFAENRSEIAAASSDAIGGIAVPLPNDASFHLQWGMHNDGSGTGWVADADIDAPEAWQVETGQIADPITIAIIDSGVDPHIEFSDRLVPGINTADPDPTATDDDCFLAHGTHVAGIAGAGGNNGLGVAGVCWGCKIMPVDVLLDTMGGCSGNVTDLAEGITWAADNGADVINISLQYCYLNQSQQTMLNGAVDYAYSLGAVLVAATGNNTSCGTGQIAWPARLSNTIATGGITGGGEVALLGANASWTSNWGSQIDVVAPGDDVYSCSSGNGYRFLSGTSMATPHVSGVAALIRSATPTLTNAEVVQLIKHTAGDIPVAGWDDRSGHGLINAHRAITATAPNPGVPATSAWALVVMTLLALVIDSAAPKSAAGGRR